MFNAIMMLLGLAMLGVVGTMDRHDQEAMEEFKREFVVVTDEQGEPQLVSLKHDREMLELYAGVEKKELGHVKPIAVQYVSESQGLRPVR